MERVYKSFNKQELYLEIKKQSLITYRNLFVGGIIFEGIKGLVIGYYVLSSYFVVKA